MREETRASKLDIPTELVFYGSTRVRFQKKAVNQLAENKKWNLSDLIS